MLMSSSQQKQLLRQLLQMLCLQMHLEVSSHLQTNKKLYRFLHDLPIL